MPNVFVDTNIFLCCFDNSDPSKRDTARNRVAGLEDALVTSTQVLQEFYWNATKKLRMTPIEAKRAVEHISLQKVIQIGPSMIVHAIDTSDAHRISFWDALIIEAAAMARCSTLLSEDLNHGQVIRGIKVENPFANG
ncbi:MAG: PIN domain-containing protein [Fimbriimonas sp.]|nr:PIN domain-containing protein [Fimbriimonas sp.]